MSDTTTVLLALISTAGGCFSAWMATRSKTSAKTAVDAQQVATKAANYAVEQSLRPPPGK